MTPRYTRASLDFPIPPHTIEREPFYIRFKEGLLHILEFAFADNRFDFFHDE